MNITKYNTLLLLFVYSSLHLTTCSVEDILSARYPLKADSDTGRTVHNSHTPIGCGKLSLLFRVYLQMVYIYTCTIIDPHTYMYIGGLL